MTMMTTDPYLYSHTATPFDFLATYYDCLFLGEADLDDAYNDWCAVEGLAPGEGSQREASFNAWLGSYMEQLHEDAWLPTALSERAMVHWNMMITLACLHWQLGAPTMTHQQSARDERAGVVVYEHPVLGAAVPLLVQFGWYSNAPSFQTDCHDPAAVWQVLGMSNIA